MTDRSAPRVGRPSLRGTVLAAASLVAGVLAGSGSLSVMSADGAGTPFLASAKAAALVEATSGAASIELRAAGAEARVINASLPYSSAPIAAARPFFVAGDDTDSNRALLCLTQAVYYEAGFEPIAGRRAVAQVVLNRMRHPAFPKSVCGVVYQSSRSRVCQFTFVCDGALFRQPEAGAWQRARSVAQAALAGYVELSVGTATHYHADYVAPRWAPLLAKVARIGSHIFYRWPGAWGQPQAFTGRYTGEPADPVALRPAGLIAAVAQTGAPLGAIAQTGPPVRRAPNDVGGLLDTSKGWNLKIPDPRELRSGASEVIAHQQAQKPAAPLAVASAAAPISSVR